MTATRRIAAILAADYARLIGEDEAGTVWASVAAFDYRDLRSGPGWPLHVDSGHIGRRDFSTSATPRFFLEGRWRWVLARYLGQVHPDADFIPAASRALYTLPRPMFSAVAMSVSERPALKSSQPHEL